ncbi:MAG: NAD(P)H-dependent glycerol-3-phosphate dehydrogenase [bacterium]|nr:NAD(P)H-dependent glycerol-3-phosphate dehydrogenase [bacterium]
MSARIGVIGAGGWGTALSLLLHRNGHDVDLWEFFPEYAERMAALRRNPDFLPGVEIPEGLRITSDLGAAVRDKDALVFAVPSHVLRRVAVQVSGFGIGRYLVISAVKGIENETLLRMSEVLREAWAGLLQPDRIVALSGPSHAEEVSRGIPTAVVAASASEVSSRTVQDLFRGPSFRLYTSSDVIGVELGGALKNVIAIAAGISDGVGFGDNTKAALMTRGIAEISRLGEAMGAAPGTFSGLSGTGDLIVTCSSRHSRNRLVGEQIGSGRSLDEVLSGMKMVAEGVRTARSAMDLSRKHRVEMPITREVVEILFNGKDPRRAVAELMTREPKKES